MKKLVTILSLMVAMFMLVACQDELEQSIDIIDVLEQVEVDFNHYDSIDFVTSDLDLLNSIEAFTGVEVSWVSSEELYVKVDGEKGIVTRQDEDVEVTLTANISFGDIVEQKYFILTIKGHNTALPSHIATVKQANNYDYVHTQGLITALYHDHELSYIFIQDQTGDIAIHAPLDISHGLESGQVIEVHGYKTVDNSFIVISHIESIRVIGVDDIAPEFILADEVDKFPAKYVQVSGLISKSYNQDATEFKLLTTEGVFHLMIPSGLDDTIKNEIKDKLTNLDPGILVELSGPIVQIGNVYYIYVVNPVAIEIADFVLFDDVVYTIKAHLNLPDYQGTISDDLDLLKTSELDFGATIEWRSSNPSVLSNQGIVTLSEDDVDVTLTYVIYFDEEIVDTRTYHITIAAVSQYEGYYKSLSGKSGSDLKQALTSLIKNTGRATGSTNEVKTVDNFNGQNYNIYTGFGAYGNREHVWPNSKLGNAPKYDLHNLRAAVVSVNSSRSNYPFTNQVTQISWQRIGSTFYPGSEHVGDVARIVLYISIRYNLNLNLVGNQSMFLNWHAEDPVSPFELSRNSKIENIQSNRNPFIDHPELVQVMFS